MRLAAIIIILGFLLFFIALTAMAEEIQTADSLWRTVAVPKPPWRIAALSLGSAELIRLKGCADRVAGAVNFVKRRGCGFPEISRNGGYRGGARNGLGGTRARPDLVITFGMAEDGIAEHLHAFGIETLLFDFFRSETILSEALAQRPRGEGEGEGRGHEGPDPRPHNRALRGSKDLRESLGDFQTASIAEAKNLGKSSSAPRPPRIRSGFLRRTRSSS